jgi:hypothetical protein
MTGTRPRPKSGSQPATVPTLVVVGEHDIPFLAAADYMATKNP